MSRLFDRLSPDKRRDARVLASFVRIFCREQHKKIIKQPFQIQDQKLQAKLAGIELCPTAPASWNTAWPS